MSSKRINANFGFLSNSSGIRQKHEGASIPSNIEDTGHVSPSSRPSALSSSKINPNFYKESEEVSISHAENFSHQVLSVLPQSSLTYPSAPDARDTEDSGSENEEEYQASVIVPQYVQSKASAVIDEDYDT
jgi:hypothetical protein